MVCMKLLNCSGLLISVASGTAWLADTLTALGLAALSMVGATGAWLMIPTSTTIVSARSCLAGRAVDGATPPLVSTRGRVCQGDVTGGRWTPAERWRHTNPKVA